MSSSFTQRLQYNNLQYGVNILSHMKEDSEHNFGTLGDQILDLLQKYRSVKPEFMKTYYEMLMNLLRQLRRYSDMCESCMFSGKYEEDRLKTANQIKTIIADIEKQKDVMDMLKSYLT